MIGTTGEWGATLELVTAVSAVIVAVAQVDGGQALAVGAHKFTAGADFGI